jgi:hypothetical protein
MGSDDKTRTLSDADISSQRTVSRRSLLGTLGLGVAAGATMLPSLGRTQSGDLVGRSRDCPYAETDPLPRGDRIRARCGRTDNDRPRK